MVYSRPADFNGTAERLYALNSIILISLLNSQVELQRRFSPPSDGSVPRLIHQSWKQDVSDDVLSHPIYCTMKEVGLNLDAWPKAYEDISLYLFMMNNHCHFDQMKGTQLGDIMGNLG
ncbi:unnamed protein product [Prunus armeniaca]|uniref:Exocyst complex subunit Exo70 C-terminal domain-containing protein n=1 Tax=Prunus armeniaca TaxID=36596 RepID=A0A6J5UCK6_PRUAR|nr:unnamed protein product [Prunus armeniaca]